MKNIEEAYANNFWQLGNLITGFGATEALLVTLAVASRQGTLVINLGHPHRRAIAVCLTLVFHFMLCFAIFVCYKAQMGLLSTQDHPVLVRDLRLVVVGKL